MKKNSSDFLIQCLYDWGIRRIYGFPGDGINGIMGALNRAKEKVRFIQSRHEELAAFEACAHAKFTGEIGVCLATSGPGAIHLLNGLYDAKKDHMPVLAIVGQQATIALGSDYQQEVDLISLFKDVAHNYVHMASDPAQIRQLVDRAVRIAIAERTVTCIIIPNDIQEMDMVTSPPRKHGANFSGVGYRRPRIIPTEEDLDRAAEVLNAGKRVAMLVGAGALGATELVMEVAELLGAGVAKALLGKMALPDNLPYVTGTIGLLGTRPSWDMMMNCDTFFMIGSTFPYSEFLPKEGQAKGVQIDIQARSLSIRFPMDVNLHGETALTLQELLPKLKRKEDRSWRSKIEKDVTEWWQIMEARAMMSANPINPQRLFWELSPMLPDNCILTCDSGSAANWYARDIKVKKGMMGSLSGGLATMCPGVPYALAAKFAYPDRLVVAMVGDGAMQMLGNLCLINIGRSYSEWSDPRLIILVLNNRDLNQVTWEQRIMSGDPKFSISQDVPAFNYAEYGRLLGIEGIEIRSPEEIKPAYQRALEAGRPVVLDAHCDPDVPPLPPHINFEQAKGYMSTLFQGDPNEKGIINQSAKQMISDYLIRLKP